MLCHENHFYQGLETEATDGSGPNLSPPLPKTNLLQRQTLTQQNPVPAVVEIRSGQVGSGQVMSGQVKRKVQSVKGQRSKVKGQRKEDKGKGEKGTKGKREKWKKGKKGEVQSAKCKE